MSQKTYLTLLTDPLTSMTHKSRCSSVVEHFLGREEVVSSILTNGSSNGSVEKISSDGNDEDPDSYRMRLQQTMIVVVTAGFIIRKQ